MKRNIIVSVKYSEDELEKIEKNAWASGRKRPTYIRETSLGNVLKEKPTKEFYESIKQLRYISNNLNQIARNANSNLTGFINESKYDEQVKILNSFIIAIKKKFL